jgi:hypothetical protein
MKTVNATRAKAGLGYISALICLFATGLTHAANENAPNPTGKFFVAETDGASTILAGDKILELTPKSVHQAKGSTLETQSNASLAIVHSNGTGLSLEPGTRLQIVQFQQTPFPPNRPDLELEPSISTTQALLQRGTISISTSKLAAGTTMNYQTRHIDVAIHGSKVVIDTNDERTTVAVLDGSATLRDRSRPGGQSLLGGQQAFITRAFTIEQPVITIRNISETDQQRLERKAALASMARRTVYFEVADRNNPNTTPTRTQNVFNRSELEEDVLVPVTVLPGAIPGPNTVSPFRITRTVIR